MSSIFVIKDIFYLNAPEVIRNLIFEFDALLAGSCVLLVSATEYS